MRSSDSCWSRKNSCYLIMYNILCNGRKIHQNLSAEECAEILDEYAQKYYDTTDQSNNPNQFKIEVINSHGNVEKR